MRTTQPISFARAEAPQLLLLQGTDDTTVLPGNVTALAAALGRPAAVKLYPGLGHIGIILAISKPFHGEARVLDDVDAFWRQEFDSHRWPFGGCEHRLPHG